MSSFLEALEQIVREIEYDSDGRFYHIAYGNIEADAELQSQLQQFSSSLSTQYLNWLLKDFISDVYFKGIQQDSINASAPTHSPILENNTVHGRHVDFYQALHSHNMGKGYFDPGWEIIQTTADGLTIVEKNDLQLYVNRSDYLAPADQSAAIGDTVSIRLPKNLVEPDLYVAVGNVGTVSRADHPIEIYWNLSAEKILDLLQHLTFALNQRGIPFTFKVPYHPSGYKGCDTATLCIRKQDYKPIHSILQRLYLEFNQVFSDSTPVFTKQLAPGIALAESPDWADPQSEEPERGSAATFGQNRCQLVATGFLWAHEQGITSKKKILSVVEKEFEQAGISLEAPYLNPDSEDTYIRLN